MFVQNLNNNIIIFNNCPSNEIPLNCMGDFGKSLNGGMNNSSHIYNVKLGDEYDEESASNYFPRPETTFFRQSEQSGSNKEFNINELRAEQIECLLKALENTSNIPRLARLVSKLTSSSHLKQNCQQLENSSCRDALLRAKALVLFHERRFSAFYNLIETNQFANENHSFLQELWNEAHYLETEMQRGKKLDPVSRYRIRKKNNFPRTIWDGECTSYCFKKSSREILKEAYRRHSTPNQQEKHELSRLTKLSVVQVSNWFKNQRQRARQHAREERSHSYNEYSSDGAESEHENDDTSSTFENTTQETLSKNNKKFSRKTSMSRNNLGDSSEETQFLKSTECNSQEMATAMQIAAMTYYGVATTAAQNEQFYQQQQLNYAQQFAMPPIPLHLPIKNFANNMTAIMPAEKKYESL